MGTPKTVPLTVGNPIQGLGSGFAADIGNLDMKLHIPMFREIMVSGYAILLRDLYRWFKVQCFRVWGSGFKAEVRDPNLRKCALGLVMLCYMFALLFGRGHILGRSVIRSHILLDPDSLMSKTLLKICLQGA